jgi:hypothetical protein
MVERERENKRGEGVGARIVRGEERGARRWLWMLPCFSSFVRGGGGFTVRWLCCDFLLLLRANAINFLCCVCVCVSADERDAASIAD